MNETLLAALAGIGLTSIEAKVYLALVDAGPCTAGEIATKAGVHRRLAYDAVERLLAKGLVGHITKNNRKYFEAVRPGRILDMLDEKRTRMSDAVKQLEARWQSGTEHQATLLFEGKVGLKTALEDEIAVGEEILIVSNAASSYSMLRWYSKWFDERRKKHRIPVKIIFEEGSQKTLPSIPLSTIRFLPKQFMSPAAFNVYGNNVALLLWTEKPLALIIRNKAMADGYRHFFDLLWKNAKA